MKTKYYKTTYYLLIVILTGFNSKALSNPIPVSGVWEGTFMQQFNVIITFSESGQKSFIGEIIKTSTWTLH